MREVLAAQVRRGIAWVYKNGESFGGDPNRIYIGGHSSGGHLCGVALVTEWQKEFGIPGDAVKGGLCMSGMYDMRGPRLSRNTSRRRPCSSRAAPAHSGRRCSKHRSEGEGSRMCSCS